MELMVLIGIPASGKTTYAKTQNAVHISSDAIRFELSEHDPDILFPIVHERVRWHLAHGQDVVVDATNLLPEHRAPLIAIGRNAGALVTGVLLDVPLATALRHHAWRVAKGIRVNLAPAKIAAWHQMLLDHPPTLEEGFHALTRACPVEYSWPREFLTLPYRPPVQAGA